MKRSAILVVALFTLFRGVQAEGVLKGVVRLNSPGGQPLPLVTISVVQGQASDAITGDNGSFVLRVRDKAPGDQVKIVAYRSGFEVVNWFEQTAFLPSEPETHPVELLLCPEGERDIWAERYYGLRIRKTVEATYEKKVSELERRVATTSKELHAKQDELAKLGQERATLLARIDFMAQQLARVRPNEASGRYETALRQFHEADVTSALETLDEAAIEKDIRSQGTGPQRHPGADVTDHQVALFFEQGAGFQV